MPELRIPNDIEFRALWDSKRGTKEIAVFYDVMPESISRAGQRYGYPGRTEMPRGTHGARRVLKEQKPMVVPPVMRADPMQSNWTNAQDRAIFSSDGNYKVMRVLAVIYSTTAARISARWQQLRSRK